MYGSGRGSTSRSIKASQLTRPFTSTLTIGRVNTVPMTAGYSGTPLPRKLGVTPASRVLVINSPDGFDPGAPFHRRAGREPYDVVILFCADMSVLERHFVAAAGRHSTAGMIWVCWPKKSSGVRTDLTENDVRDYGLTHGRVDVKVAAIDLTWSGLKFVTRLRDR